MSGFRDPGVEIENPDDMIAATRFEVRVGVKVLVDGDQEMPYVSATIFGHPHFPAGGIDTSREVSCHFIMQREDAVLFAANFARACLEQF